MSSFGSHVPHVLAVLPPTQSPLSLLLAHRAGKFPLSAAVAGSATPYVDVIVQMVLSGADVYNLANSRGGQTTTASNSFDAVMGQQGIHIQSQLLGARVRSPL